MKVVGSRSGAMTLELNFDDVQKFDALFDLISTLSSVEGNVDWSVTDQGTGTPILSEAAFDQLHDVWTSLKTSSATANYYK